MYRSLPLGRNILVNTGILSSQIDSRLVGLDVCLRNAHSNALLFLTIPYLRSKYNECEYHTAQQRQGSYRLSPEANCSLALTLLNAYMSAPFFYKYAVVESHLPNIRIMSRICTSGFTLALKYSSRKPC